jgi:hypothetical protein
MDLLPPQEPDPNHFQVEVDLYANKNANVVNLHQGPGAGSLPARFPFGEQVLNRVPRLDNDHSSAVLTVLQRGPTPERPRAQP